MVKCPKCGREWEPPCKQTVCIKLYGECMPCRFVPRPTNVSGSGEGTLSELALIRAELLERANAEVHADFQEAWMNGEVGYADVPLSNALTDRPTLAGWKQVAQQNQKSMTTMDEPMNKNEATEPVAWMDNHGSVVVRGKHRYGGFVDDGRAIPDSWKPLTVHNAGVQAAAQPVACNGMVDDGGYDSGF